LHLEEKTDDQTRNIVISFPEGTSVYLMVHQYPCAVSNILKTLLCMKKNFSKILLNSRFYLVEAVWISQSSYNKPIFFLWVA
jgi:hypothetical protein